MEILHGRHSTDDLLPVLLRDRVVNEPSQVDGTLAADAARPLVLVSQDRCHVYHTLEFNLVNLRVHDAEAAAGRAQTDRWC